jgi:hypothetical protein
MRRKPVRSIIAYLGLLFLIVTWGSTAMFGVAVFFAPVPAMPYFLTALGVSFGIPRWLGAMGIEFERDLAAL